MNVFLLLLAKSDSNTGAKVLGFCGALFFMIILLMMLPGTFTTTTTIERTAPPAERVAAAEQFHRMTPEALRLIIQGERDGLMLLEPGNKRAYVSADVWRGADVSTSGCYPPKACVACWCARWG